jgi:uncharacterized membrane protein YeaQ/YmgE (transglycosylase-associated protein family)
MNNTVTVSFQPAYVVTWLIIGLIAGFLASVIVRGRGRGAMTSIVIGLLGALIGGFLFNLLNVTVPPSLEGGVTLRYIDIVVAFIGALIVLILFGGFWRYRGGP